MKYSIKMAIGFWIGLLGLLVYHQMAPLLLTILFTLFLLHFTNDIFTSKITKIKSISIYISSIIVLAIGFILYKSVAFVLTDLNAMLETNLQFLSKYMDNISDIDIKTVNDLYSFFYTKLKENLALVSDIGFVFTKVILGMICGIILFFYNIERTPTKSLYNETKYYIEKFGRILYSSFNTVMKTQAIVSLTNTIVLGIFALAITPLITGHVLPFWYIVLPLVALFSFIPVVGNLVINVLIAIVSLKISLYYLAVALFYFFIVHKIELVIIGKIMKAKTSVPFAFIIFGMIIGELLFHSVAGIVIGMILTISIINILKLIKINGK